MLQLSGLITSHGHNQATSWQNSCSPRHNKCVHPSVKGCTQPPEASARRGSLFNSWTMAWSGRQRSPVRLFPNTSRLMQGYLYTDVIRVLAPPVPGRRAVHYTNKICLSICTHQSKKTWIRKIMTAKYTTAKKRSVKIKLNNLYFEEFTFIPWHHFP